MERAEFIISAKDEASKVIGGVTDMLGGALKLATGAAAVGVGALAAGFGLAVSEAIDAQKNLAQLDSVLKSTGGAAGITRDEILDMAGALSKVTTFSDDAVLEGQNLLLTFTNIGKEVFPDATTALLDMATAMGTDAKTGAIQLGKALNDPLEGISALTRVGVTFSEEQETAIKKMMELGDVAGAQKIILAELQKEFGGSAEAAGQTFGGQLEILKNRLLDVAEGIGMTLLPILQDFFKNTIEPALPIIEELADVLGKNLGAAAFILGPRFDELMTSVGNLVGTFAELLGIDFSGFSFQVFLTNSIGAIADFLDTANDIVIWLTANLPAAIETGKGIWDTLVSKFNEFVDFIQPIIDSFGQLVSVIMESSPQIEGAVKIIGDTIQKVFGEAGPAVGNDMSTLVDIISTSLSQMAVFWDEHGTTVIAIITMISQVIVATIGGLLVLVSGLITSYLQIINGDWSGAWQTISDTTASFMEMVLGIVGTNLEEFMATWKANWEMLQLIVSAATMNITSGIQQWLIDMINAVKAKFGEFYDLGRSLVENMLRGIQSMVAQVINAASSMVSDALSAAGNALGGGVPGGASGARASGGPVTRGTSYMVGERGPELFTPFSSGRVTPNSSLGGGAMVGTLNINISGAGDPSAVAEAVIRELRMRDLIPATSL